MSFDEERNSPVISLVEGSITEEEYKSVNSFYPYWKFEPICLD